MIVGRLLFLDFFSGLEDFDISLSYIRDKSKVTDSFIGLYCIASLRSNIIHKVDSSDYINFPFIVGASMIKPLFQQISHDSQLIRSRIVLQNIVSWLVILIDTSNDIGFPVVRVLLISYRPAVGNSRIHHFQLSSIG